MINMYQIFLIEMKLYTRDFFGFFFTFAFPSMLLLLFGSIYGNEPSDFNNGFGAIDVSIPAYCAMIIGVTGLMAFPLTLAHYKERGIYKRLDATPVGKGTIIWIQVAVNVVMTIIGFLLLFIVGKLVYDVKYDGHFLAICFVLLLSIAAIFAIGFLFTAISRDSKITNLLCYLSYFIMLFLSGTTIPKAMFSDTLLSIAKLLPLTFVVDLLQGVFTGKSLTNFKLEIFMLVLIFLLCSLVGSIFYKRKNWA